MFDSYVYYNGRSVLEFDPEGKTIVIEQEIGDKQNAKADITYMRPYINFGTIMSPENLKAYSIKLESSKNTTKLNAENFIPQNYSFSLKRPQQTMPLETKRPKITNNQVSSAIAMTKPAGITMDEVNRETERIRSQLNLLINNDSTDGVITAKEVEAITLRFKEDGRLNLDEYSLVADEYYDKYTNMTQNSA